MVFRSVIKGPPNSTFQISQVTITATVSDEKKDEEQLLKEWSDRQTEKKKEKERLTAKSENTGPPKPPEINIPRLVKAKTTSGQMLAGLSRYQPPKPS